MPRIFDNIQQELLEALRATLQVSNRADFCVGYLNLRGWQAIDDLIQPWQPEQGQVCRVLVGMQRPPHEEVRELYRATASDDLMDQGTAVRLKAQFAAHLREQITLGIPSGRDEAGLRRLARQLCAGQTIVKLFLPYPLHAKLYLLFRDDVNNPITGFVGSSNLTLQGLSKQGELNVDVLEHHAAQRLSEWFDERWEERWAIDVSQDLADCEHINDSLVRSFPLPADWSLTDWASLSEGIDAELRRSSVAKTIRTKQGHVIEYDEIDGKRAREVIVQADVALGRHFGLSNTELDYLVNYDIKYRMGQGDDDA